MMEFSLDTHTLTQMSKDPRGVQAAICVIANRQFNPNFAEPRGIGKYQGGVTVNGREICIRAYTVMDDWKRGTETTPEEKAVVAAIQEVAQIVRRDGIGAVSTFGRATSDPLRSFFEPVLKL